MEKENISDEFSFNFDDFLQNLSDLTDSFWVWRFLIVKLINTHSGHSSSIRNNTHNCADCTVGFLWSARAYIFEIYTHRFHFGARLFLAKIKSHRLATHGMKSFSHKWKANFYIAGLNLVLCFRAETANQPTNQRTNFRAYAQQIQNEFSSLAFSFSLNDMGEK